MHRKTKLHFRLKQTSSYKQSTYQTRNEIKIKFKMIQKIIFTHLPFSACHYSHRYAVSVGSRVRKREKYGLLQTARLMLPCCAPDLAWPVARALKRFWQDWCIPTHMAHMLLFHFFLSALTPVYLQYSHVAVCHFLTTNRDLLS